jgi:hypothetical protein
MGKTNKLNNANNINQGAYKKSQPFHILDSTPIYYERDSQSN